MKSTNIPISSKLVLVDGQPLKRGSGFLVLRSPQLGEEHSVISLFKEGEIKGVVAPTSINSFFGDSQLAIFLGEDGQLWEYKNREFDFLMALDDVLSPLRGISKDGSGNWVIVGSSHQVYQFQSLNNWQSDRLTSTSEAVIDDLGLSIYGLESVSSFSNNETYAVGWGGECFMMKSDTWKAIDLPTNSDLFKVYCASDGYAYMCGDNGVIVRGRRDNWEIINNDHTEDKLWNIASFEQKIVVSSFEDLYEVTNSELTPFSYKNTDPVPSSIHSLSGCDEVLWVICDQSIHEFNGKLWEVILTF